MKYYITQLLVIMSFQFSYSQTSKNDTVSPLDYSQRKTSSYDIMYELDYLKKESTTAIIINNKLVFDYSIQKVLQRQVNDIIKFDILKEFDKYKKMFTLHDDILTVFSYTVNKRLYRDLKKLKK